MSDMSSSASMSQNAQQGSFFTPPSLPKGGGTLSGGGALSAGGPDGAAGWSIPLPVSALPARPFAPQLALSYSSAGGNGPFGLGWQLTLPVIRREIRSGARIGPDVKPAGQDARPENYRTLGPDGNELLQTEQASARNGLPFDTASQYGGLQASSWVSRAGGTGERFERWEITAPRPETGGDEHRVFWLHYSADGSITLYGFSADARVEPDDPAGGLTGGEWLPEETVTARGEHIVWRWKREDNEGATGAEQQHPSAQNRYLTGVYWGNLTPAQHLLLPHGDAIAEAFSENDWLCCLQFDYGERGAPLDTAPPYEAAGKWVMRPDPFSHWRYGFEVRTRRLCQDILLFHRTRLLGGDNDPAPALVSRLHLSYDRSSTVSWLTAAQTYAYAPDGAVLTLPPDEFECTRPAPLPADAGAWICRTDLDGFCPPRWQMADLYGDALPGLLYQDGGAWWYRAPERTEGTEDSVTWGRASPLPLAPASTDGWLMDLDADGRPEWLLSLPGVAGRFTLNPDGSWGQFIPLGALPAEFLHENAQLADLTGDGLQSLVMVGPRSVRLWPSLGKAGWSKACEVPYGGQRPLPAAPGNDRLVAFSDLPGSGQQHLVEITAGTVTYWPSLGQGRFGEPVSVEGFSVPGGEGAAPFAAHRLWLADTDGSGAQDILYMDKDGIHVFINHSGNAFEHAGVIPLPEGVLPDDTLILQAADIQGLGVTSLLLTKPHKGTPRSWQLTLNAAKPWLLSETCNNSGARTLLEYRSSAQGWLDEKAALLRAGKPAVSYLPFPVHTVSRITTVSDITGMRLGSEMRYLRGVWDGREREFAGFSRVIQTDTHEAVRGTAPELSPPAQVHTWFMTGLEEHDQAPEGICSGISEFALRSLRFTRAGEGNPDKEFTPEGEARRWLFRALRGSVVRAETYGLDDSSRASVPYSVARHRWQVRAIDTLDDNRPAALVTPVESLGLSCERIASDPVVSQTVVLKQDEYGAVLESASISYPRGDYHAEQYPDTLPEGLLAACQDEQQQSCWLTLARATVHNLVNAEAGIYVTGLPATSRSDILALMDIPEDGYSVETLTGEDGPLKDLSAATLAGYSRQFWTDADGAAAEIPTRQALAAYTETALLDEASLAVFSEALTPGALAALLEKGGYHPVTLDGKPLWAGHSNFTVYLNAGCFWLPEKVRESDLTGYTTLEYAPHLTAISRVTDAAGLTSVINAYDWRFMQPVLMTDANNNQQYAGLDALGRVRQSRFRGTENGLMTGYSAPEDKAFTPPVSVDAALELKDIPVAQAHTPVMDCWMPHARNGDGSLTDIRCGELALKRWLRARDLPDDLSDDVREPPYVISLQTDRYDGDADQQVRISVVVSDGAGNALQAAALVPPGEAFLRTEDGGLKTGSAGLAVTDHAAIRWAVTGKTEYDNKGHAIRIWNPFFANDWRYVSDSSTREGLYADMHLRDALGREYRVITAAGYERRVQYFPWFTVSEDENDTLQDVLQQREARQKLH